LGIQLLKPLVVFKERILKMKKEIIGNVWVDSGQLVITDPCYLRDWGGDEFGKDNEGEYSYAGACTATLSEKQYGMLETGMAAAFSTGGDGVFPVEATLDDDGYIISITVSFR
jgi:hypothetical protein